MSIGLPRAQATGKAEEARFSPAGSSGYNWLIATEVIVIFLLILANGIFAMSEISVVAAKKVRLQQRAEDGDERARTALALAHDPNQFLATVQVGITMVGVLAGAYGGATLAEKLAVPIAQITLVAPYANGIALGIVVAAITYLSLIIGELVPKRIGLNNPEAIASWVARPMMATPAPASTGSARTGWNSR